MHNWLLSQDIKMRGVRVKKNCGAVMVTKKVNTPYTLFMPKNNWPSKNLKILKYEVVLTWDRSHETFAKKINNKHYVKNLIFKDIKNKE